MKPLWCSSNNLLSKLAWQICDYLHELYYRLDWVYWPSFPTWVSHPRLEDENGELCIKCKKYNKINCFNDRDCLFIGFENSHFCPFCFIEAKPFRQRKFLLSMNGSDDPWQAGQEEFGCRHAIIDARLALIMLEEGIENVRKNPRHFI